MIEEDGLFILDQGSVHTIVHVLAVFLAHAVPQWPWHSDIHNIIGYLIKGCWWALQ